MEMRALTQAHEAGPIKKLLADPFKALEEDSEPMRFNGLKGIEGSNILKCGLGLEGFESGGLDERWTIQAQELAIGQHNHPERRSRWEKA